MYALNTETEKKEMNKMNYVSRDQAAEILGCTSQNIERLQLKGLLNPVPTIYPKYYFDRCDVESLKESRNKKRK